MIRLNKSQAEQLEAIQPSILIRIDDSGGYWINREYEPDQFPHLIYLNDEEIYLMSSLEFQDLDISHPEIDKRLKKNINSFFTIKHDI